MFLQPPSCSGMSEYASVTLAVATCSVMVFQQRRRFISQAQLWDLRFVFQPALQLWNDLVVVFVFQVGPTATQAMQEFLTRLQVHLSSNNPQVFSEFLLKLIHILSTER